jgi:hypothetical protein
MFQPITVDFKGLAQQLVHYTTKILVIMLFGKINIKIIDVTGA